LASGSGSNAENIIRFFQGHKYISVGLVLSNNKDAFVHERARQLNVKSISFSRDQLYKDVFISDLLKKENINYLILAGFMWLIPEHLIKAFPNRIVNIHPALLPDYGGKGMYGMNVHRAIIENKEKVSGISIHYVNEYYDEGSIIFQAKCPVKSEDSPETLAERIHELEYEYYPKIIESIIMGKN
jgi:phosphoribosylglycinamide formyltransferase-1